MIFPPIAVIPDHTLIGAMSVGRLLGPVAVLAEGAVVVAMLVLLAALVATRRPRPRVRGIVLTDRVGRAEGAKSSVPSV